MHLYDGRLCGSNPPMREIDPANWSEEVDRSTVTDSDRPDGETPLVRLKSYIASGGFGIGDRLPPERDLMVALDLKRSALRKALETLERQGRIWRHVGKGTFVADGYGRHEQSLVFEDLRQRMTPFQMMRARLTIEPGIAREAAIAHSASSLAQIRDAMESAHSATSWAEYEFQDDRFHRALAEACENEVLLAFFDQLNQIRRGVAGSNVTRESEGPPADHGSFAEHEAITDAIARRASRDAYAAMRTHLKSVSARLFERD